MRGRTNYAPTLTTIAVALVLMLGGLLGTYGTLLPDRVGVLSFVAAVVVLLLGVVFRRI